MHKKYFIIGGLLFLFVVLVVALLPELNIVKKYTPQTQISKLYPKDNCCCEFLIGDISNEELMLVSECQKKGECIEVEPLRYTPHSCCPGAPGERCESLIE